MALGQLYGIISEASKELSKCHTLSLLPDNLSVHPYLVVSLWPLVSFSGALLCGPLPDPAICYSRWRQTRMEFELDMELLSFIPSLRKQRHVDLYEFGSSLVYIVRHCHCCHHQQQQHKLRQNKSPGISKNNNREARGACFCLHHLPPGSSFLTQPSQSQPPN